MFNFLCHRFYTESIYLCLLFKYCLTQKTIMHPALSGIHIAFSEDISCYLPKDFL